MKDPENVCLFVMFVLLFSTTIVAMQSFETSDEDEGNKSISINSQNVTGENLSSKGNSSYLESGLLLKQGKTSVVTREGFASIYVKDVIRLNPSIDVISFKRGNETVGYVSHFGGIGENFILEPGQEYEISTKERVRVKL